MRWFWKKHTSMTAALENATSFEELEAVGKISACFNLQPVHDSISIDTFLLQASFAELQQKASAAEEAGERYTYHWCRMDVKDVDASDAAAVARSQRVREQHRERLVPQRRLQAVPLEDL